MDGPGFLPTCTEDSIPQICRDAWSNKPSRQGARSMQFETILNRLQEFKG